MEDILGRMYVRNCFGKSTISIAGAGQMLRQAEDEEIGAEDESKICRSGTTDWGFAPFYSPLVHRMRKSRFEAGGLQRLGSCRFLFKPT